MTLPRLPCLDPRTFVDGVKKLGEYKEIEGACGSALAEATAELIEDPPMLMFDSRVTRGAIGWSVGSRRCAGLSLGLPTDKSALELVRLWAKKI